MNAPLYSIVFTTALLGSGHCIGMCGPIVAALSLTDPARPRGMLFHLFYNAGRLTTYVFIGMLAGWIGSLLNRSDSFTLVTQTLLIAADLFVILIGLRTGGIFPRLLRIPVEFPAANRIVTDFIARLNRMPAAAAAFPTGLLMGFLPCGFLYAIALAAAGRGSLLEGGLIMLFFGLGTLPALFFFGSAVQWLSGSLRGELLRWAGLLVVGVGGYNLVNHLPATGWF
ncbi:MAG: sulfite exporter TauE/SafE family protein [Desulfobulbaceae bacterium]